MKVRYHGPRIGVDGLEDNHVYEVIGICEVTGYLRVIDESGEDYLYHPTRPQPIAGKYKGGRFELVEDDEQGTLEQVMTETEWLIRNT